MTARDRLNARLSKEKELLEKLVYSEGLSQKEAGRAINKTQQHVSRMLKWEPIPNPDPKISPREEEAYRLIYIAGMTIDQTAMIMKITSGAVRHYMWRLFKKFPSLRVDFKKPKTITVPDFSQIDQTKIVRVF